VKTLFILLLCAVPLSAQNAQLRALSTTIMAMREDPNASRPTRGATPQLTTAKHQLRDWIETLLTRFPENGNDADLSNQIHNGLRDAKLFCTDYNLECYPSNRGFVDESVVGRDRGFLIIQTAIGIFCGYDYSAYIYRWTGNGWRRIFAAEQTTYTERGYRPQMLHSIHVSEPDAAGNRMILTLGSQPGCAAAYQPAYFRVFPMNARFEVQRPVLDGSELIFVASEPPITGRILPDDLMVEFDAGGTGYGEPHKAVRHFELRNGRATQVDPIAPTPRDFVEEWISMAWSQGAKYSESPALQQWHVKVHRDDAQGDFPDPAMRCTNGTGLWQIGTRFHEGPKTYYRVRFKEPYTFTMVDVSDRPFSDCTVVDPKGDEHLPLPTIN
jgi:hypothetical protein